MRQLTDDAAQVGRAPGRSLLAVPVVVVVVVAGVWVAGGLVTDEAAVAKILTGGWLGLAGAGALLIGWRWRGLAVPVIAAYAITAAAVGGYLLYSSEVDRVVDELVVTAEPENVGEPLAPGPNSTRAPEAVLQGEFAGLAHETTGTATIVRLRDGSHVLTLTDFVTDAGPDLRVYLVADGTADITDAADLGSLRGNRGNQQYDFPADAPTGAVLIWCRAFSVGFGIAELS